MSDQIEKGSIQETLMLPLYARKICMDAYPDLFGDETCQALIDKLEYDFGYIDKRISLFAALEGGIRHYDLICEIKDYLKTHPRACVVNLGCGLDTSFALADNGLARGYNLDQPDVIALRNDLLPESEREKNIACDLNDVSWFDAIDFNPKEGAVFISGGVFYYFRYNDVKVLVQQMARRFKGSRLVFDATNPVGLQFLMRVYLDKWDFGSTMIFFCLRDAEKEILAWSPHIEQVRRKRYLTGYREPDKRWGLFNRLLCYVGDDFHLTQMIQVSFAT